MKKTFFDSILELKSNNILYLYRYQWQFYELRTEILMVLLKYVNFSVFQNDYWKTNYLVN